MNSNKSKSFVYIYIVSFNEFLTRPPNIILLQIILTAAHQHFPGHNLLSGLPSTPTFLLQLETNLFGAKSILVTNWIMIDFCMKSEPFYKIFEEAAEKYKDLENMEFAWMSLERDEV